MAISVRLIVIGLGGAVAREMGWFGGAGLFGIDFTGGTAVQVVFKKPTDIALGPRRRFAKLPDVSVSAVASSAGEEPDTQFNIDTSYHGETTTGPAARIEYRNDQSGEDKLKDIFAGNLKTYSMEIASIRAVIDKAGTMRSRRRNEVRPRKRRRRNRGKRPKDGGKGAPQDAAAR